MKDEAREAAWQKHVGWCNGVGITLDRGHRSTFCSGYDSRDAEVAALKAGWILVSERLPTATGDYLVTYVRPGDGRVLSRPAYFIGGRFERGASNGSVYCGVIAWMPLPEPYKGKDGEDGQ